MDALFIKEDDFLKNRHLFQDPNLSWLEFKRAILSTSNRPGAHSRELVRPAPDRNAYTQGPSGLGSGGLDQDPFRGAKHGRSGVSYGSDMGPPRKRMRLDGGMNGGAVVVSRDVGGGHAGLPSAGYQARPMPVARTQLPSSRPLPAPPPAKAPYYDRNMDSPQPRGDQWIVRVQIPGRSVAAVLGKGGANIRQMATETHCRIHIETLPQNLRHMPTLITVIGNEDALPTAIKAIAKVMVTSRDGTVKSDQQSLALRVPSAYAYGPLVGKKGSVIRSLKEKHPSCDLKLIDAERSVTEDCYVDEFGSAGYIRMSGPELGLNPAIDEVLHVICTHEMRTRHTRQPQQQQQQSMSTRPMDAQYVPIAPLPASAMPAYSDRGRSGINGHNGTRLGGNNVASYRGSGHNRQVF